MARGRMLNKSISLSQKFDQLPDDTCRLLATWIIPQLDCNGVFYADAAIVRNLIFPTRVDVTIPQVAGYLDAIQAAGLVRRFRADGRTWQYWPGFADNQTGLRAEREKTSYPPPPGYRAEPSQQLAGSLPEDSRIYDGEKSAEGESESESESQGEGEVEAPPAALDYADDIMARIQQGQNGKSGIAVPEDDSERWLQYRDKAIATYHELTGCYPDKNVQEVLISDLAAAPDFDLSLWRDVVTAYVGVGWNRRNVKGMTDFYKRREIPGTNGGKSPPGKPKEAIKVEWIEP